MEEALALLLVGTLIWLALFIHWGLRRTVVPALVGYLGLGMLVSFSDEALHFLTDSMLVRLDFLAQIGVAALLFRVGLESNMAGLLQQLRKASVIWLGNVILSGSFGYLAAYYLLGWTLLPSLYVAAALTATSVGVSVAIWRESGAIESATGQTLVDVAEMDDISAIVLMSLLLALTPVLQKGATNGLFSTVLTTIGIMTLKLLALGGFCYAFSRYFEHPLTRLYERVRPMSDRMLLLASTGFVIAALAGLLGFSVAIGAFFAGLIFSRDPEAVTLSEPFDVLYDLFTPFFFISIGLHIDPRALVSTTTAGIVLLIAAVAGKLFGTCGAALRVTGWSGAMLLGVSLIPRAEIAMILMRQGQIQGEDVVPSDAYTAMVFVSAVTCVVTPLILRRMLAQRGKREERSNGEE